MQIRRLGGEDTHTFRQIRLEGLRLHPEAFGASFEDEAAQPFDVFSKRLVKNTVFGGFNTNGSLQGVCGIRKVKAAKIRHIATIWGMYVTPPSRGSDLARRLLDAAIREAIIDCRSIRLSVGASNEAARRLYQRSGFKEWALDSEALLVSGVFHDEVLMRYDVR